MTLQEFFHKCGSYNTSHETYSDFHFYLTNKNGSLFGMRGLMSCDYRKYTCSGKLQESGHVDNLELSYQFSPIMFYRFAEQLFAYCNKEFGTSYPVHFEWAAYPNFIDKRTDYTRNGFPTFIEYNYPLSFVKCKNYDFSNGAKSWKDAPVYYTWNITYTSHRDGFSIATNVNKSFLLAMANGIVHFLENGERPDTYCGIYCTGALFHVA